MLPLDPDTFISLRSVPDLLPRHTNGRKVHMSAVYRWANKGVRGIRLQTVRVAGELYTSRAAVEDFINATASRRALDAPVDPPAENRRELAARRVAAEFKLLDTSPPPVQAPAPRSTVMRGAP